MMNKPILVVAAEREGDGHGLTANLAAKGVCFEVAIQPAEIVAKIQTGKYGVVILTAAVSEAMVKEVLELIRVDRLATLSLALVAAAAPLVKRLHYLEAGVDDLVVGPIGWSELWLRLKNLLSKERVLVRPARKLADITHYYQEGVVESASKQIKLRQKESKILECLTKFQHRVVGRADLMQFVWPNPAEYPTEDTIDVYIRRLRLKLGENGKKIKTYRGFGYRWEQADAA